MLIYKDVGSILLMQQAAWVATIAWLVFLTCFQAKTTERNEILFWGKMFLSCSILKKQLSKLQQNFCIIQLSFTMSIHPSSCPLRYLSIHPSGCPIRYISIHPAFLQDIFSSIQLSFKIFCSFIYIDNSSPLICIFYLSIHPSIH